MAGAVPQDGFCAVGADCRIDMDLVRRNRAGAQFAATCRDGCSRATWRDLERSGWRVIAVRIVESGTPEESVAAAAEPELVVAAVTVKRRKAPGGRSGMVRF